MSSKLQKKRKKGWVEKVLEEKMAENFPNVAKDINI